MATCLEKNPLFCVSSALFDVLKAAGAGGNVFTIKEVLDYLKTYIADNYLFDPRNPLVIHCENDLLEKAFGVKTFKITEITPLLSTNMYLLTSVEKGEGNSLAGRGLHLAAVAGIKNNDVEGIPVPKRQSNERISLGKQSNSPIYIDICETPVYDSSPETVWSIQGYETAVVNNSSDDLWYLESEEEFEVEVETEEYLEYEVESLSSSPNEDFSDTESEVADVVGAAILVCQNDSDVEFWADSSDNEGLGSSDSDPEITDGDKWKCTHCSALNRPLLRFCQKCWQLRTDWLPDRRRPKRHHRMLKRTYSAPNGTQSEDSIGARRRKISHSLSDFSLSEQLSNKDASYQLELSSAEQSSASDLKSVSAYNLEEVLTDRSSQELLSKSSSEKSLNENGSQETVDSNRSQEPLAGTSKSSESSNEISTSSNSPFSLCNLCLVHPKNASIIHGKTGHQMCCYGCGIKLWERNKRCPVCRRTIQKVIRNFIV